jgi:hypothetical protein
MRSDWPEGFEAESAINGRTGSTQNRPFYYSPVYELHARGTLSNKETLGKIVPRLFLMGRACAAYSERLNLIGAFLQRVLVA